MYRCPLSGHKENVENTHTKSDEVRREDKTIDKKQ
jgi:hypothetical protein